MLRTEDGSRGSNAEILDYFSRHPLLIDRIRFIKERYHPTIVEMLGEDGRRMGVYAQPQGLLAWEGRFPSRTSDSLLTWHAVVRELDALTGTGQLVAKSPAPQTPPQREQQTPQEEMQLSFDSYTQIPAGAGPLGLRSEEEQQQALLDAAQESQQPAKTPETAQTGITGPETAERIGPPFPGQLAEDDSFVEQVLKDVERIAAAEPPRASNLINYEAPYAGTAPTGPKARCAANIKAIEALQAIERRTAAGGEPANAEEQKVLAAYSGWGGLSQAFDPSASGWSGEYARLKSLLNEQEYAAARSTVLSAYYTPPAVVHTIYRTLERFGVTGGNVLEPSMGTGTFFAHKPSSFAQHDAKLYGVELDSLTGRISKQLYQKAKIQIAGYETARLPDNFFDCVVGNVPFGDYSVSDPAYDRLHFKIHDYFLAKSIDKLRTGGIMAVVTTSGTMDKKSEEVRKHIAARCDLIGAVRLPNNAFSGTRVMADILFLQKRDAVANRDEPWLHLGQTADGISLNQYFVDHPEMVCGEMKMASGPHGPTPTCVAFETEEEHDHYGRPALELQLEKAMQNLQATLPPAQAFLEEKEPDAEIERLQRQLNVQYDAFRANFGLINSRGAAQAFQEDSNYFLLCSLEDIDDEGNYRGKTDLFSKRTIRARQPVDHVDTAAEALAVSIGERARVDLPYMSRLTGKAEETITEDLQGVIFKDPLQGSGDGPAAYLTADEYLSGDVRQKLTIARLAAEKDPVYRVNVQALEQVQPKDLDASEITVRLGATWISAADIGAFMDDMVGMMPWERKRIHVEYSAYTGMWHITNKHSVRENVKVDTTYGTTRANFFEILEKSLNLQAVKIYDTLHTISGDQRVLNNEETQRAQEKQRQIEEAFSGWIFKDQERRQRLVKLYNERYNSIRPREYDGSHIQFVGMNPEITLRPHQRNAIAHILYGHNTLLAHVVGAGKTYEMVAGTNVQRKLVALHHLDVPWRPSDIEQREGRMARQGNENKEVSIYRYVTEGTFDAYSWQLIENKQKFIAQIMTSKSPARTCDDLDEAALSYAEVKALAAGNPLIKEKMDLDLAVARLRNLHAAYQSQHYKLEDDLALHYPAQIQKIKELIENYGRDIATRDANTHTAEDEKETFEMELAGTTYSGKEDAGQVLLGLLSEAIHAEQPVPVGHYKGFEIRVRYNLLSKQFSAILAGAGTHETELGADTLGNITRMNNVLSAMEKKVEGLKAFLEKTECQVESAGAELAQPFAHEQELAEKEKRLATLDALLGMNAKGQEADILPEQVPQGGRKLRQVCRER